MTATRWPFQVVSPVNALGIRYTFDSGTADADPGAARLRLNNATQNAATFIYADLTQTGGADVTTWLDSLDDSTSAIKGQIGLFRVDDASKFIILDLTTITTATGYRKLAVSVKSASSSAPFVAGDSIMLTFARAGDKPAAISEISGLQTALDNKLDDTQATAFGLSLLDDPAATNGRSTLGLGTAAVANIGTGAGDVMGGQQAVQEVQQPARLRANPSALADSVDLDTITSSGFYRIGNTPVNGPAGGIASFGQMLVLRGQDTIAQTIFIYTTGDVWTRSGNPAGVGGAGSWSAWRQLANNLISTAVTGIGTVTRSIENCIRDLGRNVLAVGGVDGTDISTALNQAIVDCNAAGGGTVFIPEGDYIANNITLLSNVMLRGVGRYASRLRTTSATLPMFTATSATNVAILDLGLDKDAGTTKTAGAAIKFDTSSVCVVRNVEISNQFLGIEFLNSALVWVDEVEIQGIKPGTGTGVLINGGNDHYLSRVFCKTVGSGSQAANGIKIVATGATWLNGCGALWCGTGLLIAPGSGQVVEHMFSTMNAWDSGTGHGMHIAPTGSGIVRRNYFVQDWTATNSENGLTVAGPGTATVDGNFFIGHRSINNQKHGILVSYGVNFHCSDAEVSGNSGLSANGYDGINIGAGVSQFALLNNRCGAHSGFSDIQRFGIRVESGASDRYRIIANDVHNNVSGGMSDLGTGVVKQVHSNIPIQADDRWRGGGVNFHLLPVNGWQIDGSNAVFTLSGSSEITIPAGSGLLALTDAGSGSTGLFLLGGGAVVLVSQSIGTTWAVTSTPTTSQIGVYYDGVGLAYKIKNGFAGSRTISPVTVRTRSTN